MAKSHPAPFDDHDAQQLTTRARNAIASFTLLICLISLNTILNARHGVRVASALGDGLAALDLAQLLNASDGPVKAAIADLAVTARDRAVGDSRARRYRVSSEMTTTVVAKA